MSAMPSSPHSTGHKTLGVVAIVALLGAAGGIIYSGATMQGEGGEGLHETLADIILGRIALHFVAVIAMSLLTRDDLIGAFITGSERAGLHPGGPMPGRPLRWLFRSP